MGRIDKFERNVIINGNFELWERGTSVVLGSNTFQADRWNGSVGGGLAAVYEQLVGDGPNSKADLVARHRITTDSVASGRFLEMRYNIEGYDWLESIGKKLYMQFYARSSVAGFFGLGLAFNGTAVPFVSEFEITQVDTWELVKVLIPNVPEASWNVTNGVGAQINISPSLGSDFNTAGLIGQWSTAHDFLGTPNIAANTWGSSIGHTFDLSQVMLFPVDDGFRIDAIGATGLPFRRAGRIFQEELALARRYYQRRFNARPWGTLDLVNRGRYIHSLHPDMRAAPTVSIIPGSSLVGVVSVFGRSGAITASAFVPSTTTTAKVRYFFTHSSSFVIGDGCGLNLDIIQADAEL